MYLVDSNRLGISARLSVMPPRAVAPESVEAIAERLILTREALGLTQAAFAQRTGITPQALNNYEQLVNRISLDQALLICRTVGVTLDWIYRGSIASLPFDLASRIRELEAGEKVSQDRA